MATEPTRIVRSRGRAPRPLILSLWILVILLAGALGYTLWLNRTLRSPETQTKIAEQASQEIIDAVSKVIVVPSDKPTVATITDVDKLKQSNPEFYKSAQNGDVLLIYGTQAIIYRKEENRIIAVAPVVVNPDTTSNATKDADEESNETNTTNDTESFNDTSESDTGIDFTE